MKPIPMIVWQHPGEDAAPERPAPALSRQSITYRDAAILLGKSPRTIRRWVAFGLLPVVRVTQRTVFVCRNAVDGLIRSPLPWTAEDAKVLFAHGRS